MSTVPHTLRIHTVIPAMGVGGAETVAADLVTDARDRGHEVLLASGGGHRADALVADGIRHLPVPLASRRPGDLARSVRTLRRGMRAGPPDLVHAHNVKAALVSRLAVGGRAPVVATLHGVPVRELPNAARVLRRCADHVVAVSPHVAAQLEGHGFPAARTVVVPNAVSPPPLPPPATARAELGTETGLRTDVPVVLCLARMVAQKRHDLLLEAWARVPGDAVLLLAGDGPTRPEVEERVRVLGLADRVRVLGARTDVGRLLACADLVVLPTDWEGLPVSLLEAMGAGVAVLASGVGGVAETLGSGARLVPPGEVDALADALRTLLADPAARARLAERGRRLVERRHGPGPMREAYAATYAALVGASPTAVAR